MNKRIRDQHVIWAVLLLWLFASLSGTHAHYCFDGMEPPVSVHFEMASGHPEHSDEAAHVDVDNKPSQITALKVFNIDSLFLLAALLVIGFWPRVVVKGFTLLKTPLAWLAIFSLRPPLRAPPAVIH